MTYLASRILQKPILRSQFLKLALISFVLIMLPATPVSAQWTTPDGSGNINSTNSGNVGIGNTSPESKLDVNGTIKATGLILNIPTSISPVIFRSSTASVGQFVSHNLFEVQTATGTVLARMKAYRFAPGSGSFDAAHMYADGFTAMSSSGHSPTLQVWKDSSPSKALGISLGPIGTVGDDMVFSTYAMPGPGWVERFRVLNANGNVGIGTSSPGSRLHVYDAPWNVSADRAGSSFYMESHNNTGQTINNIHSVISVEGSTNYGYGWAGQIGVKSVVGPNWGPIADARSFYAQGKTRLNFHSITNYSGFYVDSPSVVTNSSIANAFGLYVGLQKATNVVNGYGVYQAGGADINYFAGNVGIGTTSPGFKLDVSGQIRSSTGGFMFPDGSVQITAAGGAQSIFKNIANAAGTTQFSAGSSNDSLRFEGTGGTSVSFDASNKKLIINSTGGGGSGTITGVTAGTGLTGGGTTGTVTLAVNYGSSVGTAVEGNKSIGINTSDGIAGGNTLTLGTGGSLNLTNTDKGSSQNIFKNVANGTGVTQFSAGANNDALRFEGTGGTSISFDANNKKVIISSTGGGGGGTITGVTAGAGMSGGGTNGVVTLDNTDRGSVQSIFKNIGNAAGTTQFSAAGNNETLLFEGTGGTSVSFDTANKKVIINSSTSGGSGGPTTFTDITFGTNTAALWVGSGGSLGVSGSGIIDATTLGGATFAAPGPIGANTRSSGAFASLDVSGNVNVTGTGNITAAGTIEANIIKAKYQDVAEWVPASEQIPAGTVVVLDSTKSNHVIASNKGYDTRVAGVVSAQPGIALGERGDNKVLVATTGRVRIKVDASRGPIRIGDLLVTSDVPGLAMKSEPVNIGAVQLHRPGTLIGKALEPLERGSGKILVLLSLQ